MGREAGYCAGLMPLSVVALAAVLAGRPQTAVGWLRRWHTRLLGDSPPVVSPPVESPPRAGAVAGHAVIGVLLGALAIIPFGLEVLFVARGVLYGVVVPGPYADSWGGPSRGGAWLAHFLIALPIAVAGLLMLRGIAGLHIRLSRRLSGGRVGRWVFPVALLACTAGALFTVAWSRQI